MFRQLTERLCNLFHASDRPTRDRAPALRLESLEDRMLLAAAVGNRIDGHIVAALPGHEHRPSIDVFLQRVTTDSAGRPVMNQPIQSGIQTWVVIHGRTDSSQSFRSLAAAIDGFKSGDQVLVLDWSEGASDNHQGPFVPDEVALDGAAWIPHVGAWAKQALTSLGVTSSKLDLVGHSWGSFVAYEIANRVPGVNERIVALDPAAAAVDYNYQAVNFSAVSARAWSIYGDGLFGSSALAKTADESFLLQYQGLLNPFQSHDAPVAVFESLVRRSNQPAAPARASLFGLAQLEHPAARPWRADGYRGAFEGVFTLRDTDGDGRWGDSFSEVQSFQYRKANNTQVTI